MFYSLEFLMNASTIFFTLVRLNQSTKYMLKVATEMQSNLDTRTKPIDVVAVSF